MSDVAVLGAGFAGLSAAVRLAAAGLRVMVVEEAPRLGGRATVFVDRDTGARLDNGQHVLFGCYRETYAFLDQLGTAALAPLQPRLRVRFADRQGRSHELSCPPWRPPWHLAAGIVRWTAIPLRDRLGVLRLSGVFREVRRDGAEAVAAGVPPGRTVTDWLVAHGQSARLREWLWDPLAFAALNQSPDEAAAAPFVRVLGEMFGTAVGSSSIGVPSAPLDELYAEPARSFIEARGGSVSLRSPGRVRVGGPEGIQVTAGGRTVAPRAAIVAVPWHAMDRVWDGQPPPALGATIRNAVATASSPIVTVNLWYEGYDPARAGEFIGLIGGPMHWVFARERHLAVVSSGAGRLAAMDNAEATRAAVEHLRQAIPDVASGPPVRSIVVRERRATFSLAPGGPPRPASATRVPGLFLAGDWTDTGLPGTIEGAVRSGHTAAGLVLESLR